MAKAKPNKNQAKKKAKVTKPAKVVKKDDKKVGKKPIAQAAIAGLKKAKSVLASVVSKKPEAKKAQAPEKNNAKANAKGEKAAVQAPSKADAKLKSKSKKVEKKSDDEFEDDLLGDDFGDSEIAEYEEDLKEVEDEEEDDKKDEEIYLTDSEGRRLCKVRDCDQVANVDEYCRFHYLLLWKKIQIRKDILNDGKLEKYVEDLTSRYPDKFLEVIRKDLKTEKDFLSVIQEMELDENALTEAENEDEVQSFADEIRGIGEAPSLDEDGDF
jgi:hypothetical protein